ncbi:hypothetical protein ACN9MY_28325 [Pseudoduganella sp. R-31]|uniref:hypothetical protein n=1 Tax=Pseudoduganella sp. R-31 TaxID=3404060 RepID=UPI003CEEFAC7
MAFVKLIIAHVFGKVRSLQTSLSGGVILSWTRNSKLTGHPIIDISSIAAIPAGTID